MANFEYYFPSLPPLTGGITLYPDNKFDIDFRLSSYVQSADGDITPEIYQKTGVAYRRVFNFNLSQPKINTVYINRTYRLRTGATGSGITFTDFVDNHLPLFLGVNMRLSSPSLYSVDTDNYAGAMSGLTSSPVYYFPNGIRQDNPDLKLSNSKETSMEFQCGLDLAGLYDYLSPYFARVKTMDLLNHYLHSVGLSFKIRGELL